MSFVFSFLIYLDPSLNARAKRVDPIPDGVLVSPLRYQGVYLPIRHARSRMEIHTHRRKVNLIFF